MNGQFGLVGLLFVLLLVIIVFAAVAAARRAKARREAFAATASSRGWGYSAEDPRWVDYFEGSPFGLGHNRSAKNVLTGRHGDRDFVAFDYCYYTTETSTDSQGRTTRREVSHPYAVVGLQTGVVFPPLTVEPEGFFSRIAGRITGRDIELESEDFNRAFTVTCTDRKFASDVLHPRQMEFLLTRPDFAFRFTGPWVLTIDNGRFEEPEVAARLEYVATVVDQVPDFIWKEVRG